MRTVFLGSPPFGLAVFERLCGSRHRPLALVTPPDRPRGRGREVETSPLVRRARELGVEVLQPADPHEPEVLAQLRARHPEVLFVASYGVLLGPALLELAPHGALNAHASLLPRWRGASPIQAALLAGDRVTGVSIQRIVRALDAGDVLLAREHEIAADANAASLLEALSELAGAAAVEALDQLESGRARFTPQDPARVTRARKLTKASGDLDWTRPAVELERLVRAMTPWPGARFVEPAPPGNAAASSAREVTVLAARCCRVEAAAVPPGTLLDAGARLVVATGAGALELERVTPAGKKPMGGADYLRGARLAPGARLPAPHAPNTTGATGAATEER